MSIPTIWAASPWNTFSGVFMPVPPRFVVSHAAVAAAAGSLAVWGSHGGLPSGGGIIAFLNRQEMNDHAFNTWLNRLDDLV
jgi:hypothetical protein